MTAARDKTPITRLARIALTCILGLCAGLALKTDWRHSFSTNVFDLITNHNGSQQSLQEVESSLQQQLSREIVLVVKLNPEHQIQTVDRSTFLEQARNLASFSRVSAAGDLSLEKDTAQFLYEHRFDLLFPKWLSQAQEAIEVDRSDPDYLEALATYIVDELDEFLATPESSAFESLLTSDPMLLIPGALENLKQKQPSAGTTKTQSWVFSAQLHSPPTNSEVKLQLQQDLDTLVEWTHTHLGQDSELLSTGFHSYASESETRIRNEIYRLNLLSLSLTICIAFVFLRKPWLLIPVTLIVAASIGSALVVTLQLLGTIHIIALVVGSILVGVAVDYCFHILFKREELEAESFRKTLRLIRLPLAASCLSTMFGFLVLLANPVSAIKQVGVFVSIGLGFAVVFSSLTALAFDFEGKVRWSRFLCFEIPFQKHANQIRLLSWILALIGFASFLGLHQTRDNIQDLQIKLYEAPANEAYIRGLTGENPNGTYWITVANSIQDVIDKQMRFSDWLTTERPDAEVIQLAALLPSSAELQDFLLFRKSYGTSLNTALEQALEQGGFDASAFEAFWADWTAFGKSESQPVDWEVLYRNLQSQLHHPLSFLIDQLSDDVVWGASYVITPTLTEIAPPKTIDTFLLAPLASLNRTFSNYRNAVSNSLWISVVVIVLSLLIVFRWKQTARILQIPMIAVLITLGVFTALGEAFTFFHLIGLLLGGCITLDYAIFSVTAGVHSTPVSIRASALTTLASFAVLSVSQIPAVSDLGVTVFTITILGLLLAESHRYR